MLRRLGTLALLAFVLLVPIASAHGFGGRWNRAMYSAPVVYYSAPVYVQPIRCVPIGQAMAPKMYAVPTPAPASSTKEPPLGTNTIPKISESYYYERHYSPTTKTESEPVRKDVCRVGFWNVTGQDVALTVAGRVYTVPRNRQITLDLSREFAWRIDQRGWQSERVPDDRPDHEIVIR